MATTMRPSSHGSPRVRESECRDGATSRSCAEHTGAPTLTRPHQRLERLHCLRKAALALGGSMERWRSVALGGHPRRGRLRSGSPLRQQDGGPGRRAVRRDECCALHGAERPRVRPGSPHGASRLHDARVISPDVARAAGSHVAPRRGAHGGDGLALATGGRRWLPLAPSDRSQPTESAGELTRLRPSNEGVCIGTDPAAPARTYP